MFYAYIMGVFIEKQLSIKSVWLYYLQVTTYMYMMKKIIMCLFITA